MLLIGGANGVASLSTATTEQFDAANPAAGWSFKAPLPESRRNVNTVILPDGDLLAVGGNDNGASNGYVEESELYSPATNTWTPMASQSQGRGYHSTAILLPDARVLSAGDDTAAGGGWENDIAEIYSPPYLFPGARPSITSAPRAIKWGSPFTIGTSDAVARAVLIAPGATTHGNDMNQRHVELAISPTAGGIQAIAPPSANVAPPGPYMLFLLNAQGVPSVARFVQVGNVFDQGGSPAPGAGGSAGRPRAGAQEEAAGAVPEPQAEGRQGVGQPRGDPRRPPEPPGGGRHPRPPRPGTRDGLHQEARAEEGQEEAGRLPGAGAARPRPRCSFGSS